MKKTLIALSVAGFVVGSASAVTVYNNDGTNLEVSGSARVMLSKTSSKYFFPGSPKVGLPPSETNDSKRLDLKNDESRIKFKFTQQIADGFSALGFMELRPGNEDFSGDITTKYLYAGFQADNIGTLTFGKQKVAGDAFKLADPAEQDIAIMDAMGIAKDAEKAIRFTSSDFYGLSLDTSYMFSQNASKTITTENKKQYAPNLNAYQLLAKYEETFGGVGVKLHALYSHQKNPKLGYPNNVVLRTHDYSQQAWGLSGAIQIADLGLGVDYVKTKVNENVAQGLILPYGLFNFTPNGFNRAHGLQIAMTYQIAEPVDIYALYHRYSYAGGDNMVQCGQLTGIITCGSAKGKVNGFTFGTHYYITKNVMTYLEYNRDSISYDDSAYSGKQTYKGHNNAGYLGLRVFF